MIFNVSNHSAILHLEAQIVKGIDLFVNREESSKNKITVLYKWKSTITIDGPR